MKKLLIFLTIILSAIVSGCFSPQKFNDQPDDINKQKTQFQTVSKILKSLPSASLEQTLKLTQNSDKRVRRAAALKLSQYSNVNNKNIIDALTTLLKKDPDYRVRSAAARSIGLLNKDVSSTSLVAAICDKDPSVSLYAQKALNKLGIHAANAILAALSDDFPDKNMRCKTVEDTKSNLQQEIKNRLLKMDSMARTIVNKGLSSTDNSIVLASLQIAGNLGFKVQSALPQILLLAQSQNEKRQLAAINTIGRIGDLHPLVMPVLFNIQSSAASPTIKMAATRSIASVQALAIKSKQPNPNASSNRPPQNRHHRRRG